MNETLVSPKAAAFVPNELARRAQGGCHESFELLVRHFRPRLVLLLSKRLAGSLIDPEDMAQEALTKAFLKLESFNDRYQFSTWVYTIAFRTATDFLRRDNRVRVRTGVDLDGQTATSMPIGDDTAHGARTIWDVAKQGLPPSQFEVLWLRFGEDLSIEEVARCLDRTKVGTRVLLHRARSRLKMELQKNFENKCDRLDGREWDGKDDVRNRAGNKS